MHVLKTQRLLHSSKHTTTKTPARENAMKKKLHTRRMTVPSTKHLHSNSMQARLLEKKTPSNAQDRKKRLKDLLTVAEKKLNYYKNKKMRLKSMIATPQKKYVHADGSPGHSNRLQCKRPVKPKIL